LWRTFLPTACGHHRRVSHYRDEGGQGLLIAGAVASGALEELGTAAEIGAGEFSWEVATGVFFLIRFLIGAAIATNSAWTGFGVNRGVESSPDVSECTEMVCGS
jgi:hypothetical protein